MADNFSFAVVYGTDGPGHEGYHNPEIIEGIIDILSKSPCGIVRTTINESKTSMGIFAHPFRLPRQGRGTGA